MESRAVEIINRIQRHLMKQNGLTVEDEEIRYVLARKDFAQLAHDDGEVPSAEVAVGRIRELCRKHDLNAESLAMLITDDEELLTNNFASEHELGPFGSPRYKRSNILAEGRTANWKRLSKQRDEKLSDAYYHFRRTYPDICDMDYNQVPPSAEEVLERVVRVAKELDVDPWYLMHYVQQYELSDWKLLYDRKAYLYHGLRRYFQ